MRVETCIIAAERLELLACARTRGERKKEKRKEKHQGEVQSKKTISPSFTLARHMI